MQEQTIRTFALASDGIDPARVPYRTVHTGARIPIVGLGTFGSDHVPAKDVARAVREAIALGYRQIDCASVYGNEAEIGKVLRKVLASGLVERDELWITSKVWNDMHGAGDVLRACTQSLKDLGLDYLDLYLVHWPFSNYHPPRASVESRSPNAKPYIHESFLQTWRQMERLMQVGLVRHIGTSNMTIPKLKLLLRDATIKPACNEMELHPHFQQPELFRFVEEQGIVPIGYCPLGSPHRPERDRMPDDTVDLEDPVIVSIARRLGVSAAMVCLKWGMQRGQVTIPFSTKRNNLLSNLRSSLTAPLSAEDMHSIADVDRNCRLIKGQVFLWNEGQNWEDLWDVHGEITPP